ncbi:hypothetical protein EJB05_06482, partial [Eragrostis curvula]
MSSCNNRVCLWVGDSLDWLKEIATTDCNPAMGKAKRASIFIRLVSAAGTGFFYVKRKNPRRITEKLEFRKYDPRVNKHVLFTEAKMK